MSATIAQSLQSDPRIAEARKLILQAVADHQKQLTGIRPANPDLKQSYEQALEQFNQIRGGNLYYPFLGSGFGAGPLVELADGSVKFDMINGIGVHYLGHSHPKLIDAAITAALSDTIMEGNLQQNVDSLAFAKLLIEAAAQSGAKLNHCFLTATGATANENALKLCFQKHAPASRLLAFEHCFAGRTLLLSQITDKPAFRVGLPKPIDVDYVPFFDASHPKASIERAMTVLKEHLHRYPRQHAAMIMELVQGEGGYYAGDRDFFLALVKLLRENNVAIMADEIQTFGRTTRPFAFQHFGLDEFIDVVSVGKLSQVCATLFRDEYKPQPNLISQTFTASTTALVAGKAIIETLLRENYFGPDGRIQRLSDHLINGLKSIAARHPGWINGPFGIGAMIAFTAFDGDPARTAKLLRALFDAGVIAFIAGASPARVRFLMPVGAIDCNQIDSVLQIVEKTLESVAPGA